MSAKTTARELTPQKWVDEYADMLYKFVASRVADKEIAKDIVQETFLSAWKAREGYKGEASEKNWLFTICRNKVIDYYRKEGKKAEVSLDDHENSDFFDTNRRDHWKKENKPKDWGVNYNQAIETKEFYAVLSKCQDKLQSQQQAVFTLKHIDDMPTKEICKVLGISSSNYWVLMHRAKLQLRKCIEKNWFEKH